MVPRPRWLSRPKWMRGTPARPARAEAPSPRKENTMASSSAGKKLRVYEVAKDLGMSSDVILQIAKKLGVEVKNHMSTLATDVVEKVRSELAQEKAAAREVVVRQQEHEAQRARDERARQQQAAQQRAQAAPSTPTTPAPYRPGQGSAVVVPAHANPHLPQVTQRPTSPPPRPGQRPGGPGARPGFAGGSGPRPGGYGYGGAAGGTATGGGFGGSGPRTGGFGGAGAPPRTGGFGGPSAPGRGFGPPGGPGQRRRDRKKKKQVDERQAAESARKTLASLDTSQGRRKHRREDRPETAVDEAKILKAPEFITLGELANMMQVKAQEVIAACMRMGLMATINKRLDKDSIEAVADEFGWQVEFVSEFVEDEQTVEESVAVER